MNGLDTFRSVGGLCDFLLVGLASEWTEVSPSPPISASDNWCVCGPSDHHAPSAFNKPMLVVAAGKDQGNNLPCFLCNSMFSAAKHHVGLSEEQLQALLQSRCRLLIGYEPECRYFVDSNLPEIYFSLNYDLSSKDVCVSLKLCEQKNPFAQENMGMKAVQPSSPADAHRFKNGVVKKPICRFCEKIIWTAKSFALSRKKSIEDFAHSTCERFGSGTLADDCLKMAAEKIDQLAYFVDKKMIEGTICAKINQCK
uniref:Saposin B-type domain-containing protein n=1 Tax=Plectus sambesii TaxID=2011161 RepID=A0A914VB61_9BILA